MFYRSGAPSYRGGMGYAILRTQKLKSPVAVRRSMKHAFREQETPNADPDRLMQNTHMGANSVAEGMAAFKAALPAKYRKDAVLAIEYLVTSSPEDMASKTREQQDQYFHDALEWLRSKHGAHQVIYAGIHRDEKTPHMYAYVVPVDPDTGRLNAKRWLGGAKALNQMQTDFAHQVGEPHGLQRGIEGSKARHTTVQEFYRAIQTHEHTHGRFSASQLEPLVLEKKFLSKTMETPEMVAERLTKAVHEHYSPVLMQASVAQLERRRASDMADTAKVSAMALKRAQERLRGFESIFEGLGEGDKRSLSTLAAKLRRDRKIEAERKRRAEAIPNLAKNAAGAAATFAEAALAALKESGDWLRVDWDKVEKSAIQEAVTVNHQPMTKAVEAIFKYSPAQAGKTQEEIDIVLSNIKEVEPDKSLINKPKSKGWSI